MPDEEKEKCRLCIWWGGVEPANDSEWCRMNGGELYGNCVCRMYVSINDPRIKKLYE